mmetsp:Transcript_23129/g.44187  ORF Transcript_23129/g.44187 Transcript_23129/m.44187 type:complete len:103 (+) Transcript_23129:695-1003(+)
MDPRCGKWRVVTLDFINALKKPYFCQEHPDPKVNGALDPCSVPEDKVSPGERTTGMGRTGNSGKNPASAGDDVLPDEVQVPISHGCKRWVQRDKYKIKIPLK